VLGQLRVCREVQVIGALADYDVVAALVDAPLAGRSVEARQHPTVGRQGHPA
jgi:hypothetical protein